MSSEQIVTRSNTMTEQEWMVRGLTASLVAALIVAICVECFL